MNKFASDFSNFRSGRILEQMDLFLTPGETILSVGDGPGDVSRAMQNKFSVKVQGLDIVDWAQIFRTPRTPDVPLELYDGKTIPYADNSFDVSVAIFVLHHCDDPESILREMIRVSRKKIVIIEDIYDNRLEKAIVCLMDYIENKASFISASVPFNFRTPSQWGQIFDQHNLELIKSTEFKFSQYWPVRHHAYCLQKAQNTSFVI